MAYRTILIASAALVAASPAFAQQTADPTPQPPTVTAEPSDDEPVASRASREEVYVTGARPLPVQRVEGARTLEQRRRDREEGRCVLRAQESADPTEPNLGVPEAVCRDP
jgi:hypothetical protein